MHSDILLQWQDNDGSWQRGYPVEYQADAYGRQVLIWLTRGMGAGIVENIAFELPIRDSRQLLVMPLYSTRPVAVWVEITKLSAVPDRTD